MKIETLKRELQAARLKRRERVNKCEEFKPTYRKAKREFMVIKRQHDELEADAAEALQSIRSITKSIQELEGDYEPHCQHFRPTMHSRIYFHGVRTYEDHAYNRPR
jgi:predicted  nucleic acid-binding Zn-ribbon protein